MRIGVHKLGFENSLENKSDKNGMFTEVNLLISIFNSYGHNAAYVNTTSQSYYDIIFVFNGYENRTSSLKNLSNMCPELNYLLTDSRFYEGDHSYVDNFFVQSSRKMYGKPTFNSNLHKLPLCGQELKNINDVKNERLIFGGSVRERKNAISEFIFRPEVDYFLRYEDENIDKRLPIELYRQLLKFYSYGIVLINPKDILIGSITWRYYEYVINNVITFVEKKSDPFNQLLSEGHFLYVSSYLEMRKKMKMINSDNELREKLLLEQIKKISIEDQNGKTFIKSLLESREENVTR